MFSEKSDIFINEKIILMQNLLHIQPWKLIRVLLNFKMNWDYYLYLYLLLKYTLKFYND